MRVVLKLEYIRNEYVGDSHVYAKFIIFLNYDYSSVER